MMDYIPFVVQAALSTLWPEESTPNWWNAKMGWSGHEEVYTPAEMWEIDPMAVINRIESYLEPQVFT